MEGHKVQRVAPKAPQHPLLFSANALCCSNPGYQHEGAKLHSFKSLSNCRLIVLKYPGLSQKVILPNAHYDSNLEKLDPEAINNARAGKIIF